MADLTPPGPAADRNLLFGILAVQMDFISRDALIAAMQAWVLDKAKPLGQILVEQSQLGAERRALLDALVAEHLKAHAGDLQQSLAALGAAASLRQHLSRLADAELSASLSGAGTSRDVEGTGPFIPSAGDSLRSCNGAPTTPRYRILRPYAKGGLGEVSVAEDQELHREVALKEIQRQYAQDPTSCSRFLLEAEVTGRLEHPGVVPVYGLGTYADGRPYYAMRLIRGQNLREAITRFHQSGSSTTTTGSPRPPGLFRGDDAFRRLLSRFVAVCNAVAYAHSRGVVHRDLKPSNIMLGKFGETLVVDWGLAKVVGRRGSADAVSEERTLRPSSGSTAEPTRLGAALGTPAYMSPEQASGRLEEVGPASDVYGLGATLYTLLTNQPPLRGKDVEEVLHRAQRGEFPRPRQVNPQVPAALEAVCLKAMAPRSADRYPTPLELAADVERWLADEPVAGFREPLTERLTRWGRRHRTVAAAIAALLITAVVGLSVGSLLLAEKNRQVEVQRARATEEEAEAKASSGFLSEHILMAAMPEGLGLGKDVTLRQALDAGAKKIDQAFAGQPKVEARVRETLGISYFRLGAFKESEAQLRRCVELREETLGPEDPETLRAKRWLSRPLLKRGRLEEAEKLAKAALAGLWAKLGVEDKETLEAMRIYAQVCLLNWNPYESRRLLERALPAVRQLYGDGDTQTLIFLNDLGAVLTELEAFDEAEPMLREAVAGGERPPLGPEHPYTLKFRENLAWLWFVKGQVREAEQLLRELVVTSRRIRGVAHDDTQSTMDNLARLLESRGAFREAEQLEREIRDTLQQTFGPEEFATLRANNNLAVTFLASGQIPQAEEMHQQVLDATKRLFRETYPYALISQGNLAYARWYQGKLPDAEALFRATIAVSQKEFGPDRPGTLMIKSSLAQLLAFHRKFDDAETLSREVLAAYMRRLGSEHPNQLPDLKELAALPTFRNAALHAMRERSLLLLWQKKLQEAETLRQRILDVQRPILGPEHFHTLRSLKDLGWIRYYQGDLDRADALFQEAIPSLEHAVGREHVVTRDALLGQGLVLLHRDRPREAETLFRQLLTLAEENVSSDSRLLCWPNYHVALALAHQGRWQEAEPFAREAVRLRQDSEPLFPNVLATLAWIDLELGHPEKAEPLLREALDLCRKKLVWPDHIEPHAQSLLGAALAAQSRLADAEPLLLRGAEALLKPTGAIPPPLHVRQAVERVIKLYDALGEKDKATEWRKKLGKLNGQTPSE